MAYLERFMNFKKEILCTVGPSSINAKVLQSLTQLEVSLLRINLSHTNLQDLEEVVSVIRRFTNLPICFDSEGAQLRTGSISTKEIELLDNQIIEIHDNNISDGKFISLNPTSMIQHLKVGDFLSIDFNAVFGVITRIENGRAWFKALRAGKIGQNKAITVDRDIPLKAYSEKDLQAFEIGKKLGIKHYALSFASSGDDVKNLRKMLPENSFLISKIESKQGYQHLNDILHFSDAVLIDRGDMSRQAPIEYIPVLQKEIINRAKSKNRKVYVATNLLESMISNPLPTRGEVNDIYNTLNDGADGLVLAAETAIGRYPEKTVEMVKRVIDVFNNRDNLNLQNCFEEGQGLSFLNQPNTNFLEEKEILDITGKNISRTLEVPTQVILDCECLANGTFSPLNGFCSKEEINSILDNFKTPSGFTWTIPIVFQYNKGPVAKGENIILKNASTGGEFLIIVSDVFTLDLEKYCEKMFMTKDLTHPGVKYVNEQGNVFIAGEIFPLKHNHLQFAGYQYTPKQLRKIFKQKGWRKIVGFHSRNIPHQAHEYIQRKALEMSMADGLLISPVIGPKKTGDFLEQHILKAYDLLVTHEYFDPSKTLISGFNTFSRYAGPREAFFTAICRKNMGCSHFIIGRDHTGVGSYYSSIDLQEYARQLGDIGIEILYMSDCSYDPTRKEYFFQNGVIDNKAQAISGTSVRQLLINHHEIPEWLVRPEISQYLKAEFKTGKNLFY